MIHYKLMFTKEEAAAMVNEYYNLNLKADDFKVCSFNEQLFTVKVDSGKTLYFDRVRAWIRQIDSNNIDGRK